MTLRTVYPQWVHSAEELEKEPPTNILDWLTKPFILSRALRKVCQTLSVQILNQDFNSAHNDEMDLIGLDPSSPNPLVRQVFLKGDDVPFTYGRVVVPKSTYDLFLEKFSNLGTNLFGETLLYGDPTMKRQPFEWTYLNNTYTLFQEIENKLQHSSFHEAWARRSVFNIQGVPLLVTEVFLPSIPSYNADSENDAPTWFASQK